MTTDNSPMLSQPAADNAPMISGRGTRIIADARGAYLAGNLRGIVQYLNDDQAHLFRRVLMRQGIRLAESLFRYEDGMPELPALEHLRQWAESTIPTEIPDLYDTVVPDPTAVYAAPYSYLSLQAQIVLMLPRVTTDDLVDAAEWAVAAISTRLRTLYHVHGRRETEMQEHMRLAKHWQIDAAWAILQHRDPPPLE